MVVYLSEQSTVPNVAEWQRIGFDISVMANHDINMDILDRTIISGTMPSTIVVVTDRDERAEALRRLKRWVNMTVVFAPQDAKEYLKRSANQYVTLGQIYDCVTRDTVSQEDIFREIIEFIATTSIPFVGASYLTRTALPQQMQVCTNDEARQALTAAETEGLVILYDHVDDSGATVRAVKLNTDNEFVQTTLEEMDDDFYPDDEPEEAEER